jgi:hypothetical protein
MYVMHEVVFLTLLVLPGEPESSVAVGFSLDPLFQYFTEGNIKLGKKEGRKERRKDGRKGGMKRGTGEDGKEKREVVRKDALSLHLLVWI